ERGQGGRADFRAKSLWMPGVEGRLPPYPRIPGPPPLAGHVHEIAPAVARGALRVALSASQIDRVESRLQRRARILDRDLLAVRQVTGPQLFERRDLCGCVRGVLRDPDQLAVSPLAHPEAFDLGVHLELAGLSLLPLLPACLPRLRRRLTGTSRGKESFRGVEGALSDRQALSFEALRGRCSRATPAGCHE